MIRDRERLLDKRIRIIKKDGTIVEGKMDGMGSSIQALEEYEVDEEFIEVDCRLLFESEIKSIEVIG